MPSGVVTPAGGGAATKYALLQDQEPSGTTGGTPTATAWNTRVLNTEAFDVGSIVTLAANQFTLAAGTYFVTARAAAVFPEHHKLRVRDITNTATLLLGGSHWVTTNGEWAFLQGRFTLAGTTVCELQHYFENSLGTFGLGTPVNAGVIEIFAEVEIVKES